ncbi:hypothetical protein OPW41_17040 [Vibrio europaeus]|uniref:C-type lysozyme inhibitor domain-containing protein n=1 Tax=Vibrio europaeus TaxID=300876 RepID=A0A178JD48_9VIBR|nr:hypothetical protein [Vibrio europaeus]MDC5707614.1 hypothetical protein [Vibrio europaeus]MDC5709860.1 hypothetical protein [Vibrio europaeus]MDC5716663.1 hypothetical protein [Vibrio europaeus]MDC5722716.1 hypothetical protein [Vibrio europaeus]MDC5726983.1 hypothetical protein [Vibrio europaeus]
MKKLIAIIPLALALVGCGQPDAVLECNITDDLKSTLVFDDGTVTVTTQDGTKEHNYYESGNEIVRYYEAPDLDTTYLKNTTTGKNGERNPQVLSHTNNNWITLRGCVMY